MRLGIILTNAPSWKWVLDHVPQNITTIKVVTGWGLSWTHTLRQEVFNRFDTVIVRTVAGDLSHRDGAYFMPEAARVEQEIRPWHNAWNKRSRFIVQIGNEPLLDPVNNELIAWQYAWNLDAARRRIKEQFGIETMSFAHMINHWVTLNGRNDGQRRWTEISFSALEKFDLLGVNAYTAEQVAHGIDIYRGVGLRQPIWISEFNLNESCTPQERAQRFSDVLAPFQGIVEGVTAYHLVDSPDDHPIHSNPNYTLHLETLSSWKIKGESVKPEPPPINHVGMTRKHYFDGRTQSIRCVVLHATAGRFPGDYNWLRQGGHLTDKNRFVSIHYYIRKDGAVFRMVDDKDAAWHAGASEWLIDGTRRTSLNSCSIGIELENLNNGSDPYPQPQIESCVNLVKWLSREYNIPREQVVTHYQISPGRKTDPVGFPITEFLDRVFSNPWNAWGTLCPLDPEKRGWSIPQAWIKRWQELGAATTYEQYLTPKTSVQVFERGLIIYDAIKKGCTVVVF